MRPIQTRLKRKTGTCPAAPAMMRMSSDGYTPVVTLAAVQAEPLKKALA
jgi:hypothetical protein